MWTVVLISDFQDDYYHAVMKGVILKYHSNLRFIDINVNQYDIASTAWVMLNTFDYFPENTVFSIVVDPGVGTSRLPLLTKIDNKYIITPDNGIIYPLTKTYEAEIYQIQSIEPESNTFHGRDLFSPAVGLLINQLEKNSINLREFGDRVDTITPYDLKITNNLNRGKIVYIDKFGNLVTNLKMKLTNGEIYILELLKKELNVPYFETFEHGPTSEIFLITGSADTLEIVMNKGSASQMLQKVDVGTAVKIRVIE